MFQHLNIFNWQSLSYIRHLRSKPLIVTGGDNLLSKCGQETIFMTKNEKFAHNIVSSCFVDCGVKEKVETEFESKLVSFFQRDSMIVREIVNVIELDV